MAAKKTERPGLIIKDRHISKIRKLPDSERLVLFDALLAYWADDVTPDELPLGADIIFEYMREGLDYDKEQWAETCRKNAENARKRWGTDTGAEASGTLNDECDGMPDDATASSGIHAECDGMPDDANKNKNMNMNKELDSTPLTPHGGNSADAAGDEPRMQDTP